jgi:hypothetical protein
MNSRDFSRVRIAEIVGVVVLSLLGALVYAQTAADTIPDWQKAAGGKLSFEVASIKLGDPAKFAPPSSALDYLDSFGGANPHGRFVGQFPLQVYVAFAYKIFPYSQDKRTRCSPVYRSGSPQINM